jgi:hypothetical protein
LSFCWLAVAAGTAGAAGIKQLYQTGVESWGELQNIKFTVSRIRLSDKTSRLHPRPVAAKRG